jgi:hypothetical protein
MFKSAFDSDFDPLSRFGEWDMADTAQRLPVGDHDQP